MKIISCLIDFSETSKKAAETAISLARKYESTLNLICVSLSSEEVASEEVVAFSGVESAKVPYFISIDHGSYQEKIPELIQESHADLLVIGSRGSQRETEMLSADEVLKIVQSLTINVLVVSKETEVAELAINRILHPIAPHDNFSIQIKETARWAKDFNAHIDVFCLYVDSENLPKDIDTNLRKSGEFFEKEGLSQSKTLRETKVYSVGYAKDIIRYTEEMPADLIAIMAQNSLENMYFGGVEKTNLLLNPRGIPVLCVCE